MLPPTETFPVKLAVFVAVVTDQTSPVYPSYDKAVSATEPQSLARPPATSCGSQFDVVELYLRKYPSARPVKSTSVKSPILSAIGSHVFEDVLNFRVLSLVSNQISFV